MQAKLVSNIFVVIILNTNTELMSGAELMSGVKSRKWLHQKPTNQSYRLKLPRATSGAVQVKTDF